MVSFINMAFLVVKLKIFSIFHIEMKWPLFGGFGLLLSQILFNLTEILTRGSLPIRQTAFEKSFKFLNFGSNGAHPKFTVLVHFGTQFTTGKSKTLLKTKIFAKTSSLGISNNVSLRSQKSCRILVKLSKKKKKNWGGGPN